VRFFVRGLESLHGSGFWRAGCVLGRAGTCRAASPQRFGIVHSHSPRSRRKKQDPGPTQPVRGAGLPTAGGDDKGEHQTAIGFEGHGQTGPAAEMPGWRLSPAKKNRPPIALQASRVAVGVSDPRRAASGPVRPLGGDGRRALKSLIQNIIIESRFGIDPPAGKIVRARAPAGFPFTHGRSRKLIFDPSHRRI